MSHFTVCVRVGANAISECGSVESAVEKMLAPYQENNMGDCPREFLVFTDIEDESRNDYETGSSSMVALEDGSRVYPWDERFRVPGTFGIGGGSHKVPEHLQRVDVPHRERFATFEQFMAEYCSETRDEETGRYGYWENPNKKLDWWKIGGRWTGLFPIKQGVERRVGEPGLMTPQAKPGEGDIVSVDDIDFDRVTVWTHEAAEKFWQEWQQFIAGAEFPAFEGPRDRALEVGLLDVRQGPPLPGEEGRAIPWRKGFEKRGQLDDARVGWHDVYKVIDRETFFRDYLETFCPISTYAVLDENGWKEPGRMGWWGCAHHTPETFLEAKRSFLTWLLETPSDARLVVVDCHI